MINCFEREREREGHCFVFRIQKDLPTPLPCKVRISNGVKNEFKPLFC